MFCLYAFLALGLSFDIANVWYKTGSSIEEARVSHFLFITQVPILQILFPWCTERRIGNTEIKSLPGMTILTDG